MLTNMDKGLTKFVESFAQEVSQGLIESSVSKSDKSKSEYYQDAILEAFNISLGFVDINDRHSDDELWGIIAAFAQHNLLSGVTTPKALREGGLAENKKVVLKSSTDLFTLLVEIDQARNTNYSKKYFDGIVDIAHVVVSLDEFANEESLQAIVDFRKILEAELPKTVVKESVNKSVERGSEDNKVEDVKTPADPLPAEPLEDLLLELDSLVGLGGVKEEIKLLSALLKVQKLRKERDLKVVDTNKHLIFSGNPGTGKTTVARLLARIYRSLDVVSNGQFVEVVRSGLVVGYVGQTATKVGAVFDSADGGVLLIDEAYSLTRGGEKDFGREAIDAIVKQVEDRRDSMVVILAGYPAEMTELVNSNPGFQSRFPKTIHFDDYSDQELVDILKLMCKSGEYQLAEEAIEAAKVWFGSHERDHGFGNGRLARNLFEKAVSRHAQRITEIKNPSNEQLMTLAAEDIASVPIE